MAKGFERPCVLLSVELRDTLARFYTAFLQGDMHNLSQGTTEDVEWHIRGRSALAGIHRGRDAVIALRNRMAEGSSGTYRPLRPDSHHIFAGEAHAALYDRFLAERSGKHLDSHEVLTFSGSRERIRHIFHYFFDQQAFDVLWS